jgi:RNA polymerase sigma factor (sigma-70 family)
MNINYSQDIAKYSLLSADEEIRLAKKMREGDLKSRELFINSNLRLVLYVAKGYASNNNFDDLVAEGNFALVKAVDNYNPEYNARFNSFAFPIIERGIWSYLKQTRMIRIPHDTLAEIKKIFNITSLCMLESNYFSVDIIAARLNNNLSAAPNKIYSGKDVSKLLQLYNDTDVSSLDSAVPYTDLNIIDTIPQSDESEILDNIITSSFSEKIALHINKLNTKEIYKNILIMYFINNQDIGTIAADLNKPIFCVKKDLGYALRVFKSRFNIKNLQ